MILHVAAKVLLSKLTVHVSYLLKILQWLLQQTQQFKALLYDVSPPSLSRLISCYSSLRFPPPALLDDVLFLAHSQEGPTARLLPL